MKQLCSKKSWCHPQLASASDSIELVSALIPIPAVSTQVSSFRKTAAISQAISSYRLVAAAILALESVQIFSRHSRLETAQVQPF